MNGRKTYKLVADQLLELDRGTAGSGLATLSRRSASSSRTTASVARPCARRSGCSKSQGLIEARGNGAFTVSHARNTLNQSLELLLSVAEADLHELFEIRRILEGEVRARSRLNGGARPISSRMRAAIAEMESGIGSEDDYIAADLAFHLTIAEATGNRVAAHLMHALRDQLHRALGTVYQIPHSAERSLAQHREIVEAIGARRPDEARASHARPHRSRRARDRHDGREGALMASVGFVGLGVMGGGIAARLHAAGHDVVGYNRTREKARWLEERGIRLLDTPRAVAEASDVVFSMVTNTQAARRGHGGTGRDPRRTRDLGRSTST